VTPFALALQRAQIHLLQRLQDLEPLLARNQVDVWGEYREVALAVATLAAHLAPGAHGELLTTQQMAARLGIAPKTLLRRRARGQVKAPVQLGRRGRAALRWRGDEVRDA